MAISAQLNRNSIYLTDCNTQLNHIINVLYRNNQILNDRIIELKSAIETIKKLKIDLDLDLKASVDLQDQ